MAFVRSLDARSALASASLAACIVGLAGTDAGLVWIVAGVWTVRAIARVPISSAWGVAVLGAGLRWGTLSLGDVAVATRLGGPTALAGTLLVRAGMIAALVAALFGEAQSGGFVRRTWFARAASAIAVTTLVPLFAVRGPGDPRTLLTGAWAGSAALMAIAVVLLQPVARRVPVFIAPAVAAAGVLVAALAIG